MMILQHPFSADIVQSEFFKESKVRLVVLVGPRHQFISTSADRPCPSFRLHDLAIQQ
jgi:hypothetical protein